MARQVDMVLGHFRCHPYCRDNHPRNCREIGFGSARGFLPCALVGVRPFEWRLQDSAGGRSAKPQAM